MNPKLFSIDDLDVGNIYIFLTLYNIQLYHQLLLYDEIKKEYGSGLEKAQYIQSVNCDKEF